MSKHGRSSKKASFAAGVVATAVTVVVGAGVFGGHSGADDSPAVTVPIQLGQAPEQVPAVEVPHTETRLTTDGDDTYTQVKLPEGTAVVAAASNVGTNARYLYSSPTAPTSVDQISCATWDGHVDQWVQPGIMARHSVEADRTRAVTVTNNIWGDARGLWNVHVWDTSITGDLPGTGVGTIVLPVMGTDAMSRPAPPWSMCVRVQGTALDFKVWPAAETEPSWEDTHYVGSLDLPEDGVFAGKPGFYLGHLAPGVTSVFTGQRHEVLNDIS